MEELFATYPDITCLFTHRNPLEVVPSWCSLVYSWRNKFHNNVDKIEIGKEQLSFLKNMLDAGLKFRENHPDYGNRFRDIYYKDLISNPLKTVEEIYRSLGMELTKEVKERMVNYLDKSHKDRKRHTYTMEEYGLDEETIRKAFNQYTNKFHL